LTTLDFTPFVVSLRLAGATTVCLLVLGVPLALWLVFMRNRIKSVIKPVLESLVSVPLALPPTVVGFYCLLAFGGASPLGRWLEGTFDVRLAFSFWGLLVGSVVYSMPFMVQPLQRGLESVPSELVELAYLEGASKWQTATRVLMPFVRRSLLTGCVLTFAHTLGEFGIVMMIGGNIAGETRTASVALYDAVQGFDYATAHLYAASLLGLCFVLTSGVVLWQERVRHEG
jgi:molybdate transport system permease protein